MIRLLSRLVVWVSVAGAPVGHAARPARERAEVFIGLRVPL